ncbi:MAG: ASCH domain-containing protein [Roseiflexaceae bacterium]
MRVLLSIRPEFVQKIFDGSKRYEYRKRIFCNKSVKRIIIYATKPTGMIVGEFVLEGIIEDTPLKLWQKTEKFSGIDYSFYQHYYKGYEKAVALKIGHIIKFEVPINPKDVFARFTPPQSFMYVTDQHISTPLLSKEVNSLLQTSFQSSMML